jgi:multicomponent Na+:H+ antiporter subunit D
VEAGRPWIVGVLVVSSLLNAAYFLPIVARAWFRPPEDAGADQPVPVTVAVRAPELGAWLLLPPVATGLSVLVLGLFAGAPLSPLSWAAFIAGELVAVP